MPATFLLLCLCILSQSSYTVNGKSRLHNIYTDPVNGTDSPECLTFNSSATPCLTLDYAFSYRNDSTCYILNPHTEYNLTEPVPPFKGLKSLMIHGGEGSVISCGGEVGLAFVNVSTIDIMDVIFLYCAETRNSTSRNTDIYPNVTFYEFEVGLYFYLCKDVSMDKVNVSFSPNATGVVMYNTAGTNSILNSVFMNNTVSNTRHGGGGFYVEFSYCVPGDYACRNNKTETSPILGAHYFFMNSKFSDNIASNEGIKHNTTYILPYRTYHQAFGRGGGLSVFMKGAAMNNVFEISNCTFENNRAQWGGGLFVEFHDDTADNNISIKNCIFSYNQCNYTLTTGTGGGGMRIGHYVYHKNPDSINGNQIVIAHSQFSFNSAMYGGGLSVSPTLQDTVIGKEAHLRLIDVDFWNNTGKLGGGLNINAFALITKGIIMKVEVTDGRFENNSVAYADLLKKTETPHTIGMGAVYINKVNVAFRGRTMFQSNTGSALALAGSAVNFSQSIVWFTFNTGYRGGAIFLLGSSYILIDEKTQMFFHNNTATDKGGAIYNKYIEMDNLQAQPDCFIRHANPFRSPDNWEAKFIFYNNTDHNAQKENSIHSSSLLPCTMAGGDGYLSIEHVFCWKNWVYFATSSQVNCSEQISSEVGHIKYSQVNQSNRIQVIPGKTFTLPLKITNDYGNSIINDTVFSSILDKASSETVYFWGSNTSVSGLEMSHVELTLNTLGDRIWQVKFTVELIRCPPGLEPKKENGTETIHTVCECSTSMYGGRVLCNTDTLEVKMFINHWMGFSEGEGEYLVGSCPPGFCASSDASSYIFLPNTSAALSGVVCNTNRTGVMCGECTNGSGPAVNSGTFDCVHCTNIDLPSNIAKYVASIYIPLAALFTLLIVFDIRLTTGPANAFIIYSQVISNSFNLEADGQIPLNELMNASSSFKAIVQTYKLIYGIFNLEFFENLLHPLCLNPTFNALTVLSLDYGVAIFPLVMIILVIICLKVKEFFSSFSLRKVKKAAKCCPWRRRSISEALLPAFAAFILLSYTKFCLTSSYIIRLQSLYDKNMATIAPPRAYYAGQLVSTSAKYVYPYLLPSTLIFAIFVCIPPLLLLVYPLKILEWCLSKVTCLWKFYPVDKVHVFLDTFQGCYKNNMRFFAGLYFLFRLTVNALYFADSTLLERFIIQQVACVIMVTLISICQPYNAENSFLNQVDALIFANLAIINAFSLFLYRTSLLDDISSNLSTIIFQYILVFLPLIYMIGYIIWYFLFYRQRCLKKKFFKRLFQSTSYTSLKSVAADNKQRLKGPHTRSEVDINDIIIEEEDEALFARAELSNHYQKPPDVAVHHSYTTTTTNSSSGRGSSKKTGSSQPLANSNGSHAHSRINSHGYGTMSSHSTTSTN